MKTLIKSVVVAAALVSVGAPAMAQSWTSINQRQVNLDRRIDVGVRNGSLTRLEALRLRADFRGIQQLETRYRRGGLNLAERRDLDRRFDLLSARIRVDRHDRQDRRGR